MRVLLTAIALAASSSAFAQHGGHAHHQPPSAYAGMQARDIKALSAEQIEDLREGRGMGASLPAELNDVPGPMHVLQLAPQLKVTPEQRAALQLITQEMKTRAQSLGLQVIAEEAQLDKAFKTRSIDEKGVQAATDRIARLQGQVRAVHLVAHLKTRELMSDEQVAAYNAARGYASSIAPATHRH